MTDTENPLENIATKTVLFDFDGVLIRGDSYTRFLRAQIGASWWRKILALLVTPVALPLVLTRRGLPLGAKIYSRIAHVGVNHEDLRERMRTFGTALGRRDDVMLRAGIATLREHIAEGARVVIVSGCEETLLRAILAQHALDHVEIVASRIGANRRHCFGERKLNALAESGIVPPWSIAYSDSLADLPMLSHAQRPVLVNADERQAARAAAALGGILEQVRWS